MTTRSIQDKQREMYEKVTINSQRKPRTQTRYEVYNFIVNFTKKHSYPPTVREITKGVGLCSTASTFRHIEALSQEHLIEKTSNRARALRAIAE